MEQPTPQVNNYPAVYRNNHWAGWKGKKRRETAGLISISEVEIKARMIEREDKNYHQNS
jgi:hypothetical protein